MLARSSGFMNSAAAARDAAMALCLISGAGAEDAGGNLDIEQKESEDHTKYPGPEEPRGKDF